jgi:hypothetical protein
MHILSTTPSFPLGEKIVMRLKNQATYFVDGLCRNESFFCVRIGLLAKMHFL